MYPLQQKQQPQQQPSRVPSTQNDLEILVKLKESIKNGQHDFYRAIPSPAALASIYLGPNALPQHYQKLQHYNNHGRSLDDPTAPPSATSTSHARDDVVISDGPRPPRFQGKEVWDASLRKEATNGQAAMVSRAHLPVCHDHGLSQFGLFSQSPN